MHSEFDRAKTCFGETKTTENKLTMEGKIFLVLLCLTALVTLSWTAPAEGTTDMHFKMCEIMYCLSLNCSDAHVMDSREEKVAPGEVDSLQEAEGVKEEREVEEVEEEEKDMDPQLHRMRRQMAYPSNYYYYGRRGRRRRTSPRRRPGRRTRPRTRPGRRTRPRTRPGRRTSPRPGPGRGTRPRTRPGRRTSPRPGPGRGTRPRTRPGRRTSPRPGPGRRTRPGRRGTRGLGKLLCAIKHLT